MTKFEPNITLYGYHRDGTESKVHSYKIEYDLASECAENAIENCRDFVTQWLTKWDAMSNSPQKFKVELFLRAKFADGREISELKMSSKVNSSEKVMAYVDRHSTGAFRKFAKIE